MRTVKGWRLDLIDAREFADADYVANPHDRCFYCKTSLYSTMAAAVDCVLVSGTNSDDLGDYRPGLQGRRRLRGPSPVRRSGHEQGCRARRGARARPARPRQPAGIALSVESRRDRPGDPTPSVLNAIYRAERLVQGELTPSTVRCRVRHEAVVIELDVESIRGLDRPKAECPAAGDRRAVVDGGALTPGVVSGLPDGQCVSEAGS
jgi:uncharacterized protein